MSEERGAWYLLTGVLLGLALGLIYAFVLNPIEYVDAAPYSLDGESKDQYRAMVALAYQANDDIGRAYARLKLLQEEKPERILAAQAQEELASGGSQDLARALAEMAVDLNEAPFEDGLPAATEVVEVNEWEEESNEEATQTPENENLSNPIQTPTLAPTATVTPVATFTPRATAFTLPTVDSPFTLIEEEVICSAERSPGLLEIEVLDEDGNPRPGIRLVIRWEEGVDTFYTGLYPEISTGYADFKMQEGVIYTLQIAGDDNQIPNLAIPTCEGEEEGGVLRLGIAQQ